MSQTQTGIVREEISANLQTFKYTKEGTNSSSCPLERVNSTCFPPADQGHRDPFRPSICTAANRAGLRNSCGFHGIKTRVKNVKLQHLEGRYRCWGPDTRIQRESGPRNRTEQKRNPEPRIENREPRTPGLANQKDPLTPGNDDAEWCGHGSVDHLPGVPAPRICFKSLGQVPGIIHRFVCPWEQACFTEREYRVKNYMVHKPISFYIE